MEGNGPRVVLVPRPADVPTVDQEMPSKGLGKGPSKGKMSRRQRQNQRRQNLAAAGQPYQRRVTGK
eukprot:12411429-Karenia_brevis.AAC.1